MPSATAAPLSRLALPPDGSKEAAPRLRDDLERSTPNERSKRKGLHVPQVLQINPTTIVAPQVTVCPGGRVEVVRTSGWAPFWLTSFTPDRAVWDQAFATADEVDALVTDMVADLNREHAPKAVAR
jgi:hypothetical protein